MTEQVTNEEKFYTIEEEATVDLEPTDGETFEYEADGVESFQAESKLRIEDELNASWSGVRSCSRQSRAGSKITARLDDWAASKIKEHSKMVYLRHGLIKPVKFSYRNRRDWDGERSCRGWSNFRVYIEFAKPK